MIVNKTIQKKMIVWAKRCLETVGRITVFMVVVSIVCACTTLTPTPSPTPNATLTTMATTTATQTTTPITIPQAIGGLGQFLRYAPFDVVDWGELRFENRLGQLEALGQEHIRSLEDWRVAASKKQFEELLAFDTMPEGMRHYTTFWLENTGLDYFAVDYALKLLGDGPLELTILEGGYDKGTIGPKLEELGYEETAAWFYSAFGDYEPNIQDPLGKVSLGRMNRIAFHGNFIITSGATDPVQKVLAAMESQASSLAGVPGYLALAEALGDPHSATFLAYERFLDKYPDPNIVPHGMAEGWDDLHQWELAGFGFTRKDVEAGTFSIALYYPDPEAATADSVELTQRLDSYRLISTSGGRYPWEIDTPRLAEVISRYCPIKEVEIDNGTWGSTLTLTCDVVAKGSDVRWWYYMIGSLYDLGFLLPNPEGGK
jgi:hypothetical protein